MRNIKQEVESLQRMASKHRMPNNSVSEVRGLCRVCATVVPVIAGSSCLENHDNWMKKNLCEGTGQLVSFSNTGYCSTCGVLAYTNTFDGTVVHHKRFQSGEECEGAWKLPR